MKLSVVLAVYNEEDVLAACLSSVKDFAEEIVVIDGGSTDKTVEIAQSFGARVFVTDNPPIFHINKQKAVDKAKGDWILQLDADEVVPKALWEEIRDTIQSSKFDGYNIARKNYFLWYWMRKGGLYPDYVIRLFKKGKGHFPSLSVHEQITIDGKTGYLKTPLLHYTYKTLGEYWEKAGTYTDLAASEMKRANVKITVTAYITYYLLRPSRVFLNLFIRHKGFMDGIFGFLFAFFSALQEPIAFQKYLHIKQ